MHIEYDEIHSVVEEIKKYFDNKPHTVNMKQCNVFKVPIECFCQNQYCQHMKKYVIIKKETRLQTF